MGDQDEIKNPDILEEVEEEEEADLPDEGVEFAIPKSGNSHLRRLIDENFMEYASYVIKDRAIPDVDDGLKPVQRRILWSLRRMDDGKFHKVANVIGHSMQFHPHGDASIYEALVVLANKEFFIEKQGNFGNIYTGDVASAARYIECRLTPLAKEVLFNNDITEFVDSYDSRNREPQVLPCKVPSLLMIGTEGIAVGMSTRIVPHNFNELLAAQIAILRKEKYEVYPDFLQGGTMDVAEYNEGNGRIKLRARIERDKRKLIIREIPAGTTTDRLINSIENAARRNKIKISAINDYTTEKVEIEIIPARGYDPDKALKALYAYTDCSMSITCNMMLIADGRPVQMSVNEVLRHNTEMLMDYLRRELEIELGKLEDSFHEKTLAQIFIENRIYKRIEECETYELVLTEVRKGLNKFKKMLTRKITDEDIEKLLAIPIRRISLFDINKNKKDIDNIVKQIKQVNKDLKRLRSYTIKYLEKLIKDYGPLYPRHTEIEEFDRIDIRKVALNNIKVGWDRRNCYIGTAVRSEETVTCNEFDKLLCIQRAGDYRIINQPDKLFVGRLLYFNKVDKNQVFNVVYRDKKSRKCYAKKTVVDKYIVDRKYRLCPKGCKLEILTSRGNSVYECKLEPKARQKEQSVIYNFQDAPMRSPKARGQLITPKKIVKFSYLGAAEDLYGDGLTAEDAATDAAEAGETEVKATSTAKSETETKAGNENKEKIPKAGKPAMRSVNKTAEKALSDSPKITKKNVKTGPKSKPAAKAKVGKSAKPVVRAKQKSTPSAKSAGTKTAAKPKAEKIPQKPAAKPVGKGKTAKPAAGKKESKTIAAKTPKKTGKPSKKKKKNDDDDDWGISQPEFGF